MQEVDRIELVVGGEYSIVAVGVRLVVLDTAEVVVLVEADIVAMVVRMTTIRARM